MECQACYTAAYTITEFLNCNFQDTCYPCITQKRLGCFTVSAGLPHTPRTLLPGEMSALKSQWSIFTATFGPTNAITVRQFDQPLETHGQGGKERKSEESYVSERKSFARKIVNTSQASINLDEKFQDYHRNRLLEGLFYQNHGGNRKKNPSNLRLDRCVHGTSTQAWFNTGVMALIIPIL